MKKSFLFFTRSLYCLKMYIILLISKRLRLSPSLSEPWVVVPLHWKQIEIMARKGQAEPGYMQRIFNPEASGCFGLYCKAKLHHLTTHCLFFQLFLKIFTLTPP